MTDTAKATAGVSTATQIRTLLVDDHPVVTRALARTINSAADMEVVARAQSTGDAMDIMREQDLDVVVLDLFLGDGFGLDLVRDVRSLFDDVEVVVYSMCDDDVYAERALKAGARAYLSKRKSSNSVLEAIREANDENVYLPRETRKKLLGHMARQGKDEQQHQLADLTDRELAVFQMLGEGCSKEDIATKLSLSPRTVQTYRRQAREKLGADSPADFLKQAFKWAYQQ